ncbi:MAG: FAD-dependent oxidoreductase, partial [Rhodospirillales bacterium]|nr:FAD-dependent oxidoreductase [Rhodospirillales bacterium]
IKGVRFKNGDGEYGNLYACDIVIVAFGQVAEQTDWTTQLGIAIYAQGLIVTDKNGRTSHRKIFVGGDNSHGPDLVVTAVAAGRRASRGIVASLK